MNELLNKERFDNLVGTLSQIKYSSEEDGLVKMNSYIPELKDRINTLFSEANINCTDILYTQNTDKEYFGLIVNPVLDGVTAFKIFATDEPVVLSNYQLEFDSKLFELNLNPEQIASIIVFEISSYMNPGQIAQVRELIDIHVLSEDDIIHLRDSINYTQLIIYAIKDTLYKISSILFKEDIDSILSNIWVQELDLKDSLLTAQEKLLNNAYGLNDSVRSPKVVILQWVFMIYQDVKGYAVSAIETLKDAKTFTASKLQAIEIDKTINAIDKVGNFIIKEDGSESLDKFFDSRAMFSLNELGLFKSLKQSGLRSIEDDYYELAVQVKSIDTESDALFVLRAINSRLSVLEDYIYNNNIKESDKKHWISVSKMYRDLRASVLAKKINKRKYTDIFMDFNDFESDND